MVFTTRVLFASLFLIIVSFLSSAIVYAEWPVDLVRPSCSISFAPQSPQKSGTIINITASATDGESDIDTIILKSLNSLSDTKGIVLRSPAARPFNYSWNTLDLQAKDYYFTVIAKDKAGNVCINPVATFTLTPPSIPIQVNCSVDKSEIVSGDSVTWTARASGGTGTYTYQFSGTASRRYENTPATEQRLSSTITTSIGDVKYETVTVTSENQSKTADCGVVTVYPRLSAVCSPSKTTAKTGENITWTANPSGGTGNYSYSWTGTDNLSGRNQTAGINYSSAGSKFASVTVSSGSPSTNSFTQTTGPISCGKVEVVDTLRASCNGSPNPAATYQNVNWTSQVTGGSGNYSYSWNTTDGKSGTSANLSTSYTSSGRKVASLAVRSSDSQTASAECQVNIQPPPPQFTMNDPVSSCDGNANPYIHLSWTTSQGALEYTVLKWEWKYLGSYWGWEFKGSYYASADSNNYIDTDVQREIIYGYYIRASNDYGTSYTQFRWLVTQTCNPQAFNITSISSSCNNPNQGYIRLSWSPSVNATTYSILRYSYLTGTWSSFVPGTEVFPDNVGFAYKVNDPSRRPLGPRALGPRAAPQPLLNYTDFTVSPSNSWYAYYVVAQNQWGAKSNWRNIASSNCVPPVVDLKANNSDGPVTIPNESSALIDGSMRNADSCTASTSVTSDRNFANLYSRDNLSYVSGFSGYRTPVFNYSSGTNQYTYTYTCTNNNIGQSASDQVIINVSGPDLIAFTPGASSLSPVADQTVTFGSFVKNQGNAPAGISFARFCINDPGCVSGSIGNEQHKVDPLTAGQSSNALTSAPWRAIQGSHRVYVCADVDNRVIETDENNNCALLPITVNPPRPPFIKTEGGDVHSNVKIEQ